MAGRSMEMHWNQVLLIIIRLDAAMCMKHMLEERPSMLYLAMNIWIITAHLSMISHAYSFLHSLHIARCALIGSELHNDSYKASPLYAKFWTKRFQVTGRTPKCPL